MINGQRRAQLAFAGRTPFRWGVSFLLFVKLLGRGKAVPSKDNQSVDGDGFRGDVDVGEVRLAAKRKTRDSEREKGRKESEKAQGRTQGGGRKGASGEDALGKWIVRNGQRDAIEQGWRGEKWNVPGG